MPFIHRVFEEVLPFLAFIENKRNIIAKVNDESAIESKVDRYKKLNSESLSCRITEEHQRAVKIDEKTSKFTLGLSVSLTVLATASSSFVKFVPNSEHTTTISVICGIAALYMLAAGITALGSLKTLPTYGYGTDHEILKKESGASYLAEALCAQEFMNIVRQLRNEAAYQSLRNGFFMLFIALSVSVILLSGVTLKTNKEVADISLSSKVLKENELGTKNIVLNTKTDTKILNSASKIDAN